MKKSLIYTICMFVISVVYTVLVKIVDVSPIGPEGSSVGFSTINGAVFNLTGYNDIWYNFSKLLGFFTFATVGFFVFFGVYQLQKRKSLKLVDKDLFVLGIFYAAVAIVYVLFEKVVINYRPVILDEGLEPSFPSTHTILAVCVMTTAAMQFSARIKDEKKRKQAVIICMAIMIAIIIGRILAGCHWLTDIVGGILISSVLILAYNTGILYVKEKEKTADI